MSASLVKIKVTVRLISTVKTSTRTSSGLTISTRKCRHQEFDGGEFVGVHDPEVLPLALLAL